MTKGVFRSVVRCPAPGVPPSNGGDVSEVGDSGPAGVEDGVGVGVDLGDTNGLPSGSLKSKIG
jgi:hypothetical protein